MLLSVAVKAEEAKVAFSEPPPTKLKVETPAVLGSKKAERKIVIFHVEVRCETLNVYSFEFAVHGKIYLKSSIFKSRK